MTYLCLSDIDAPTISCRDLVEVVRSSLCLEKFDVLDVDCQASPDEDDTLLGFPKSVISLPFLKYLSMQNMHLVVIDYLLANVEAENREVSLRALLCAFRLRSTAWS